MSCQITNFPTLTSVAVRSNELKQENGRKSAESEVWKMVSAN